MSARAPLAKSQGLRQPPLRLRAVPRAIPGIPHPIPYQGSKRNLAPLIVYCFPTAIDTLIEPFAGSAAVSVAAAHLRKARRFRLNDINDPLIRLVMEIVNNPERIAAEYKKIWSRQIGNERRHFDLVRDRFNQTERPEDLLYLLARCVKAAVRYNSRGHFNNSPDNRRLGAQPERMSKHIYGMSLLLRERTEFSSVDYSAVLSAATDRDLVYMDPPYQGVCNTANHRYVQAIESGPFIEQLRDLNARGVPFILSYDGRTGTKTFGPPLPEDLMLCHLEVPAGRSSQATLLGRDSHTFESIYLSPALLDRLGGNPAAVLNNSSFEEQHLWPVT